jgi:hypothetical protein
MAQITVEAGLGDFETDDLLDELESRRTRLNGRFNAVLACVTSS